MVTIFVVKELTLRWLVKKHRQLNTLVLCHELTNIQENIPSIRDGNLHVERLNQLGDALFLEVSTVLSMRIPAVFFTCFLVGKVLRSGLQRNCCLIHQRLDGFG